MKKELPPSIFKKNDNRKHDFQNNLLEWYVTNQRDFPWRKNRTPYSVLVCEILLRRTTAQAVSNLYESFLQQYPNIFSLQQSDETELKYFLSKIGYHNERAKIFKTISTHVIEEYQGEIPDDRIVLLSIPHIGHYIANCILTFAYSQPTSIVDTNVEKILKRYFSELLEINTLRLIRETAALLAPLTNNQNYNYALLDLGGTICKSKSPNCDKCPINYNCDFNKSRIRSIL